ncbi:MAG: hypothetical protein ACE5R4_18130 [Armatimonadota bacterium]
MTNDAKLHVALVAAAAVPLLLACGLGWRAPAATVHPRLEYKLRALKPPPAPGKPPQYLPGEPVILECRLTNAGAESTEVLPITHGSATALGPGGELTWRLPQDAAFGPVLVSPQQVRELAPRASLRRLVDLTRWQVFPERGRLSIAGAYRTPSAQLMRAQGVELESLAVTATPVAIRIATPPADSPPWKEAYRALERARNLMAGFGPEADGLRYGEGPKRALEVVQTRVVGTPSHLGEWGYYYRAVFMARCLEYGDATPARAIAAFEEFLERYPKSVCAPVAEEVLGLLRAREGPTALLLYPHVL